MDKELQNELTKIIKQSPIQNELDHANATLKWLLYLEPDADMALKIAAFGHDIERGVNKLTEKDRPAYNSYSEFKQAHANRSAEILFSFLYQKGYDKSIIEKVTKIVCAHEFGGDKDSDLLKDADSIAYFELNIPIYLERNGEEKTLEKIHFMFDRASNRAQDIIKKLKFDSEIVPLINNLIG